MPSTVEMATRFEIAANVVQGWGKKNKTYGFHEEFRMDWKHDIYASNFGSAITETVLVHPEMERGRSPLVSIPPFGRDSQGIDTVTRLSLSMVASPQNSLPFRQVRSL